MKGKSKREVKEGREKEKVNEMDRRVREERE